MRKNNNNIPHISLHQTCIPPIPLSQQHLTQIFHSNHHFQREQQHASFRRILFRDMKIIWVLPNPVDDTTHLHFHRLTTIKITKISTHFKHKTPNDNNSNHNKTVNMKFLVEIFYTFKSCKHISHCE